MQKNCAALKLVMLEKCGYDIAQTDSSQATANSGILPTDGQASPGKARAQQPVNDINGQNQKSGRDLPPKPTTNEVTGTAPQDSEAVLPLTGQDKPGFTLTDKDEPADKQMILDRLKAHPEVEGSTSQTVPERQAGQNIRNFTQGATGNSAEYPAPATQAYAYWKGHVKGSSVGNSSSQLTA
jgi:hypothetical protein